VYNYARSATQVAYDYNRGGPIGHWQLDECSGTSAFDNSGNSYTGTLTIGATGANTAPGTCVSGTSTDAWYNGATGKFNSGLDLDGTNDYVLLPDFGLTSGSVSMWIYPHGVGDRRLFSQTSGLTTQGGATRIGLSGEVQVWDGAGNWESVAPNGTISVNNWYHLVFIYEGNNGATTLYVNGKVQSTSSTTDFDFSGVQMGIGATFVLTFGSYYDGIVDDFRVYNYPLSATQIQKLYNDNSGVRFGPNTGSP
jgi:hypothetical protein